MTKTIRSLKIQQNKTITERRLENCIFDVALAPICEKLIYKNVIKLKEIVLGQTLHTTVHHTEDQTYHENLFNMKTESEEPSSSFN